MNPSAKHTPRRFCKICRHQFCAGELGMRIGIAEGALHTGRIMYWLCEPCGEDVDKAIRSLAQTEKVAAG